MTNTETKHITLEDQGIDLIKQASTILAIYNYTLEINENDTDCVFIDDTHKITLFLDEQEKLSYTITILRKTSQERERLLEGNFLASRIVTTVNVLNFKYSNLISK